MPDADVFFNILKIAGLFVGLSFIVFWVGLVWWVSQDVLTRTNDKIIVAAAVAMTAILGPVGVMFYLIIRPKQTLKESYGEMMEHEMMLRAAASTICPMCEHMTQEDFVNCPYCGTVLKRQCSQCEKLVAMDWGYCPYCGTVANTQQARAASVVPTDMREAQLAQEMETLKQDALQQAQLERAQEVGFSTAAMKLNRYSRQKISSAGQSALSAIRQAFPAPTDLQSPAAPAQSDNSTIAAKGENSSESEEGLEKKVDAKSAKAEAPAKSTSSAKKAAAKKKATKRSKK